RARAAYLRANQIAAQASDPAAFEEAFKLIGPLLAEMESQGPFAEQVRPFTATAEEEPKGEKGEKGEKDAATEQKQRVKALAEGTDKVRRELIVLALKTRVRQGNPKAAAPLIAMLKKFGGSIEANVPVLEQLTREIADQIKALRKAGKANEANALAAGYAELIGIIAAEPDLPPAVVLFLGQALSAVEDYKGAIATLQKIPPPAQPAWLSMPAAEFNKLEEKDRQATTRYRAACLHLIRAHRLAGQFDAADAMLKEIIGEQSKPGWGFSSLIFRKEVAYLWEARGAAPPAPPRHPSPSPTCPHQLVTLP